MKSVLLSAALIVLLVMGCSAPKPVPVTSQMLEEAPQLEVEDLGLVQRAARVRGYELSPGTANYPPRLLLGLANQDGSWIINLAAGTARKADAPGFERECLGWPSGITADGQVFVAGERGGLIVYDPVADSIQMLRPIPKGRWLHGLVVGPDGGVYVTDYPTGSAARYDPATGQVDSYGPQGGPFQNRSIYGYSIGAEGEWVYTAAGKMPWYVVAYNRTTGEQTNLLTLDQTDHPTVFQRGAEVYLGVQYGPATASEQAPRQYRLQDGKATPVDGIPGEDPTLVPGHDRPQPKVQQLRRNLPMVDGGALLKYKPAGEEDWKGIVLPVPGTPMEVEHVAATSDGRLVLSAGPYGDVFIFDPAARSFEGLGSPAYKHAYDLLDVEGRIYFCGYPNSMFGVFEGGEGKLLGTWHDTVISKHAFYIVRGADGRIYSGNHAERERVGGALGWWDPKTSEFGGIIFPNDDCESFITALDGTLIVYASDISVDPMRPEATPPAGSLIVYDTKARKVVRQFSPVQNGSAGKIVEVAPGVVLGLTLHEGKPVVYTADVAQGKLLRREPLPTKAIRNVVLGPDGKVYAFLAGTLVRIDPQTLAVAPVGNLKPGQMTFVGRDLYLAGESELRRLPGIAR